MRMEFPMLSKPNLRVFRYWVIWTFALFSIGLPASGPAQGSSLAVQAAAARPGSGTGCGGSGCGARLTLSGCMGSVDLTVPDQDVSSSQTFEACDTISAADVDITGTADVTFEAGERIAFASGFSVGSSATFAAVVDRGLTGDAFVEDQSPSNETRYVARFYVNLDSMSLPSSEELDHFAGFNGSEQAQFRVVFAHNMTMNENRLFVEIRQDDGTFVSTQGVNELAIPSGWHAIEVDWIAATGPGANDGTLVVCLDDDGSRMSCEELSSIDNDLGRVQTVQWGAQEVGASTAGTFDMDDFDSRRAGPIGL